MSPHPPLARTPGPLSRRLRETAATWARSQHDLIVLAAEFADSSEWVLAGSPTAAHWLAEVADVEVSTAREWIRIGRRLRQLPATAAAFAAGRLSYTKVRTLTRIATPDSDSELATMAESIPAGSLPRAVAGWYRDVTSPTELAAHHHRSRSVTWRTEPDGIVTFTLRLPPLIAGLLMAALTALVMKRRPLTTLGDADASAGGWPSLAQQHADALEHLLTTGAGPVETEVVVHVRGDGCTLDDGTPLADSVVEKIAPASFLRSLVHDAEGRPINASSRQRHPSTRQKRVVKERDRVCVDCGRTDLLEYDHVPAYELSGHTVVDELELRCAPCHHRRHSKAS